MNKVVYNKCFGGFSISASAMTWLAENAREEIKAIAKKYLREHPNEKFGFHCDNDIKRHDPDLVRCVETLGYHASGGCAKLEIRELKGNQYRIDEYDGYETIFEPEDEEYITIEETTVKRDETCGTWSQRQPHQPPLRFNEPIQLQLFG